MVTSWESKMAPVEIPKTMITWQKHRGKYDPVRVEVPIPPLSPDGLLVRILAAGVCHTDCALMHLDDLFPPHWNERFTLGREGAGEIVAVGENVNPRSFKIGDKVAILTNAGCNQPDCAECSRGLQRICHSGQTCGMGTDGSFAPYVSLRRTWEAVKLPNGVSVEAGAVAVDAVMTAYHAVVVKADVKKWETVMMYGMGGLGLNALQVLMWIGVKRVIVVDKRQMVLDQCIQLGVKEEDAIRTIENSEAAEDHVLKNNILVDKVLDFVGVEETFNSAQLVGESGIQLTVERRSPLTVRPGGTVTLVGVYSPQVALQSMALIFKDISVHCCYSGTRESFLRCLELIAQGDIKPRIQLGNFNHLPQILKDLDAGKYSNQVVVVPE